MKPRNLRHRLEKIAKTLVLIQKHTPEVDCTLDEDKGESGHIIMDFSDAGPSRPRMEALGKELEGKGYSFQEKRSPWLGQVTYTGRAGEKPTVVLTCPILINRIGINEDSPPKPFFFSEK